MIEKSKITKVFFYFEWILIGLFENIMNMVKNGIMVETEFESLEFAHVCFFYQNEENILPG